MRSERSAVTGYAANPLDRRAAERDSAERFAAWKADPAARTLLVAGDAPILRDTGNGLDAFFDLAAAERIGAVRETVFLGTDARGPVFGMLIDAMEPETVQGLNDVVSVDLRSLAVEGRLDPETLGIYSEGKSLLDWHRRHGFCARCGARTALAAGGWRRECAGCGAQHFPRTDPVAIMLAVKGERCVLGRQARFAPGVYSCLAGFIEPGETMEDAVRRELFEESGIRTGKVRYLASQPWPFPSSLMIGCIAEALGEELVVDHEELEDCRWFTREDVRGMLSGTHPDGYVCPPPIAIAHHLLRAWAVDDETP
jgi:NAD+ diphosphatase